MQGVTGITSMAYDPDGRQSAVVNGAGLALAYGYDATGNGAGMIDPGGGVTTYGYDADGRLTGIANPYAEVTTIGYDALGREYNKVLANGVLVSHSYDAAGRDVGLSQVGPAGAAKGWYTASYDAVGNRLDQAELDGSVVSYGYDNADQLTHEARVGTEPYDITYAYDRVGNRAQMLGSGAITTMVYNEADELVQAIAPDSAVTTISYDANGNTEVINANGQVTTNSWDSENRLVGVVNPDSTVETHAYAANGLRQSKSVAGAVTNFLWDDQNILQERDGALALLADYTLFPGFWGGLALMRRSGASYFYGFDLQGSTRALTDALAAVTDRYWMTAFGVEVASSGPTANPFLFEGLFQYYRDWAWRMQVGARDLEPDWGRWLSTDPLGAGYIYVQNRPVCFIDPSGFVITAPRNPVPAEPPPWFRTNVPKAPRPTCPCIPPWAFGIGLGLWWLLTPSPTGDPEDTPAFQRMLDEQCRRQSEECNEKWQSCTEQCEKLSRKIFDAVRALFGAKQARLSTKRWDICCHDWCSAAHDACVDGYDVKDFSCNENLPRTKKKRVDGQFPIW